MTDYSTKFQSFLDVERFASMQQDGAKLYFVHARFGARHDIALGAWVKR